MAEPIQTGVSNAYPWGVEGARAGQDVTENVMGLVKTQAYEGRFVFYTDDPVERNQGIVDGSGTEVAGFAERWMVRPRINPTQGGSLLVEAGEPVHMGFYGEFYALTTTTAAPGQEVFARQTDGAIVCDDLTDTPPSGTSKTGFYVYKVDPDALDTVTGTAPANSLIIISNHRKAFAG